MRLAPLVILLAIGTIFVIAAIGMPAFGDPENPAHTHVAPRYIEGAYKEAGVINMVTAVLVSYRGYDTLFELTVIFTAVTGVISILRRR